MAETIEEISYNYEDGGKLVRRELNKEVLTRGSWTTVMFLYEELDRKNDTWGEPKIAIVRYKKFNGTFRKQSSFNISSRKQAQQVTDVMSRWYAGIPEKPEPEKAAKAPKAAKTAKTPKTPKAAKTEPADEPSDEPSDTPPDDGGDEE